MFADIMTPVVAMGLDVELVEGVGPGGAEPVRSLAAVEQLRVPDPEETLAPILEAIGIVRRELAPEQAVVGFFGGPFTVAGYLVEGKPSREFAVTKTLMYAEPEVWRALLDKLADTFAAYAVAQARAGADVVQLFDSWVGNLSPADYAEFVAPWSGRVLAALRDAGVPTIHFGTGTATLLADDGRGRRRRDRPRLAHPARRGLGRGRRGARRAGEPRPGGAARPVGAVEAAVRDVLARAGGRPGHIFNLGHGVLPRTDPDVLGRVRELVHADDLVRGGRPAGGASPVRHARLTARAPGAGGPRPGARCTLDGCDEPMTPGRIVVDRVSQRFRVSTHPQRTLKDLFVARGRRETREVWALRDVSLSPSRARPSGSSGATAPGKTTLLKLVSHIFKPTSGRIEAGGRVASLLELGAGFHPDFTGRENVYLNGSIYGLSRARVDELMDEIVAFAELERSSTCPCAPTRPGCTCASASPSRRTSRPTCCCSTRSSPSATRRSSASASGRSTSSSGAAARSSSSRTTRRPSRCSATARCCSSRARSRSTGRPARRSRATGSCSRPTPARTSSRPGCASGAAARRGSSRRGCSTPTATSGGQFAAGEPFVVELRVASGRRRPGAAALARAARRRRRRARRRHRRDRRPRLGRARRRARAPLRGRPAAARRGPLPPPLRAARRRRRAAAALAR